MNEPKFTKGPWGVSEKLSASENHKGFDLWGAYGNLWLGELSPQNDKDGNPSEQGISTVALIRQAPAMYAKLKELLDLSKDDGIEGWSPVWGEVEELLERPAKL